MGAGSRAHSALNVWIDGTSTAPLRISTTLPRSKGELASPMRAQGMCVEQWVVCCEQGCRGWPTGLSAAKACHSCGCHQQPAAQWHRHEAKNPIRCTPEPPPCPHPPQMLTNLRVLPERYLSTKPSPVNRRRKRSSCTGKHLSQRREACKPERCIHERSEHVPARARSAILVRGQGTRASRMRAVAARGHDAS